MHEQQVVMGIDLGTTSTKAVIFNRSGVQLGRAAVEYPLLTPLPAWAEQSPDSILEAVITSVGQALAKAGKARSNLVAVGFSSAMHSIIAVDSSGRYLTNSITWADNRSAAQASWLRSQPVSERLYKSTGVPIQPMSPLTKLIWMRMEQPDIFARAYKFVSIKEYIIFQLFGEWMVDVSVASASGMMSLETGRWDMDALSLAGISESQLSTIVPTTYMLKGMRQPFAERMGIHPETPFAIGGSDGALANMGVGAVGKGEIAITIGTSGAVRMIVNKELTDNKQRTFCYAIDDVRRLIGGPTNNGGIVLRWLRDRWGYAQDGLSGDQVYERMTKEAGAVPAGAEGLIFLPYLSGERAPIWDPEVKGSMVGLTLRHGREHMVRAAMEGVAMSIASVAKVLTDLAGPFGIIRASGGFAISPLWLQMIADTMDAEVEVPDVHEASALGAAMLALCVIGELNDWSDMKDSIRIIDKCKPNPNLRTVYAELFEQFNRLYTGGASR